MKTMTMLLGLMMGSAGYAASPELDHSMAQVATVYDEVINNGILDLYDMNYFLSFNTGAEVLGELSASTHCSDGRNFKAMDKALVTDKMMGHLGYALGEIYDFNDGYYSSMEQASKVMGELQAAIGTSSVEVCTDQRQVAYSDGHEVNFVKIDGELTFVFVQGFPD